MNMLLYGAELLGTAAFALSGALLGIRKRLDIFGMLMLSVVTALGGGTVRDLLLGHTPPRMFYSYEYLLLAAGVCLIAFIAARVAGDRFAGVSREVDLLYNLCDAVGLGIFAVIGTQAGIQAGYMDNAFLCIFLGMTTGVGGGILRDIMCTDIPGVLRKHVYAVAAILGSAVYYLLVYEEMSAVPATFVGIAVTVVLRLLARHYRWNLPRVEG